MIKTIITLCSTVAMLANAYGTPKLPKYGTEAWCKLPGAKEVIRAAETGDVFAKYFLAMIAEENGNRTPMDTLYQNQKVREQLFNEEKLSEALRKFSDMGFYFTQQLLAGVYFEMQLQEISQALYRKAAEQGDPVSQYNLGLMLYKQKTGSNAPAETVKLWKASAAQGNVGALKDVGLMYLKGEVSGKPDVPKAIKYLEKAAEHGQGQALFLLGEIYEQGRNGKVDKDRAIKYYKAAAIQHPDITKLPLHKVIPNGNNHQSDTDILRENLQSKNPNKII